jgi:hypothetical protein
VSENNLTKSSWQPEITAVSKPEQAAQRSYERGADQRWIDFHRAVTGARDIDGNLRE